MGVGAGIGETPFRFRRKPPTTACRTTTATPKYSLAPDRPDTAQQSATGGPSRGCDPLRRLTQAPGTT